MPLLAETRRDPSDRYADEVEVLLARFGRLTDQQVRSVLDVLAASRRRITAELLELAPERAASYQVYHLSQLRDAVDRAAVDLVTRYRPIAGAALDLAWERGLAFMPDALGTIGVEMVLPGVSALQVAVAQMAEQAAQDVGAEFRARARQIVTQGVLGELPPHQVAKQIGELLRTEPKLATASVGRITRLASEYQRNGMMSVFNVANQARHNEIAEGTPGLRKYWRSGRDSRVRPDHRAADARYRPGGSEGPIPVSEFYTVGGERGRFPHDPMLSGKQRNRCRCVSVLYREEWFGDRPD